VATYDPRGKYIYTGNSRGKILVFASRDSENGAKLRNTGSNGNGNGGNKDFKLISQFKVTQQASSTTAVKGIEFARRSKSFLVNTADRVIRVYKTSDVLSLKDGK
jgi:COMPASS component SWD1